MSVSPDKYSHTHDKSKHSPSFDSECSSSKKVCSKKPSKHVLSPAPKKKFTDYSINPEYDLKKKTNNRDRSRSSSIHSSQSVKDASQKTSKSGKSKNSVERICYPYGSASSDSDRSLKNKKKSSKKSDLSPKHKASPKPSESRFKPHSPVHSPPNKDSLQKAHDSDKQSSQTILNIDTEKNSQSPEFGNLQDATPKKLPKNSNLESEKIFFNIKSKTISQPSNSKNKLDDSDDALESKGPEIKISDSKKSKFGFGSFSKSQNQSSESLSESSKAKKRDVIISASPSKDKASPLKSHCDRKGQNKSPVASPPLNQGTSQKLVIDKNKGHHQRISKNRHSRSRSTSAARSHSRTASDRSSRSRSRSYSNRRSKSYSKSRSKSFSKSRSKSYSKSPSRSRSKSHSKSVSKSRSKSLSKSFSRSRSKSYSRSRSRSVSAYSR